MHQHKLSPAFYGKLHEKKQSKSVSWSTRLATYWTQAKTEYVDNLLCSVMFCHCNQLKNYYMFQHLKCQHDL